MSFLCPKCKLDISKTNCVCNQFGDSPAPVVPHHHLDLIQKLKDSQEELLRERDALAEQLAEANGQLLDRIKELEQVLSIIAESEDGSCHSDNVYRAKKILGEK